jgi:hypothetical protein
MSHAKTTVSIEEYVESMLPWARPIAMRGARRRGDHPVLAGEDMLQEAKFVLVQVYQRYVGKVPEIEMRRIGTRAVRFHLANIWHATEAKSRKAIVISIDGQTLELNGALNSDRLPYVVDVQHSAAVTMPTSLDSVILREEMARADLSEDERRLLVDMMRVGDDRAVGELPSDQARKIFRRLRGKVQHVVDGAGYKYSRCTLSDGGRGHEEKTMNTNRPIQKRPEEPDLSVSTPLKAAVPAAVPAAKKSKAKSTVMSASDTKKLSSSFKKGQHVTYAGGGRASWLKAGAVLLVKGVVESRGRAYVRCFAIDAKKHVSLSSALLAPVKEHASEK